MRNASGQAGAGAAVPIASLSRGGVTRADGRFLLPDLPAGTHELVVQAAGAARSARVQVQAKPGERTSVEVRLP